MNTDAEDRVVDPSASLLALTTLVLAVTAAKIQAAAEAQAADGRGAPTGYRDEHPMAPASFLGHDRSAVYEMNESGQTCIERGDRYAAQIGG